MEVKSYLLDLHNKQIEEHNGYMDRLKAQESIIIQRGEDLLHKQLVMDEEIAKVKELKDGIAKIKKDTTLVLARSKNELEKSEATRIVNDQEKEKLEKLKVKVQKEHEALVKQKEALDEQNSKIIKNARFLEMEERRIKAMEIEAKALLKDAKIKEAIGG